MRPVICLITDRRQLEIPTEDGVVAQVAAASKAGVHLVQIRERDLEGRALLHLVRACVAAVGSTSTRVIVNERLDVALAAGAHGVHLRGDSLPASRARTMAPRSFLIGRSVHDADEARRVTEDGGLDYLVFGPVFDTSSKPGRSGAGVEALRAVVSGTVVPVLAVGGITQDRVATVSAAGAAGFAAISLFSRPGHLPRQVY
jgi:thiamine-phosphate pyrophosphorylase